MDNERVDALVRSRELLARATWWAAAGTAFNGVGLLVDSFVTWARYEDQVHARILAGSMLVVGSVCLLVSLVVRQRTEKKLDGLRG